MSSKEKRSRKTARSRMRSQGSKEGAAIIVALLAISSMLGILIALGETVGEFAGGPSRTSIVEAGLSVAR